MRSLILILTLGLLTAPVLAEEADVENGAKLHTENCLSCHQSMFEDDGNKIYTREDRRVTDADKLHNQVQRCSLNLKLEWFDSEINDVSAYLEQQFYQFNTEKTASKETNTHQEKTKETKEDTKD